MMNRLLLLVALFAVWASPAQAQQKARATLYARSDGALVRAAIEIKVAAGWHLYHEFLGDGGGVGTETTVTWGGEGILWSPTRFPEPKKLKQPGVGPGGSDGWIFGHEGKIVLFAVGRFESGTADLSKITLEIVGLTCEDGGSCIP